MLKKKFRIPGKNFPSVLKGKKIKNKDWFVFYCRNGLSYSRFRVNVSAKAVKKAVQRNQIKRFVYQNIQANFKDFPQGYDFFIQINKLSKPIEEIIKELLKNIISIC